MGRRLSVSFSYFPSLVLKKNPSPAPEFKKDDETLTTKTLKRRNCGRRRTPPTPLTTVG